MKTIFLILLLLLVTSDITFSRKASKKFDKKTTYKGERIRALQVLLSAQNSSILEFDDQLFTYYALEGPRDYSLIVLFTSETSSFECPSCRRLLPILTDVADKHKSLIKGNYERSELFFAKAELSRCQDIFHQLRNKLPTLPQLIHIRSTPKQRSLHWSQDDIFPIEASSFDYRFLVQWVTHKTGVKIPLEKSNTEQYITIVLLFILFLMVAKDIPSILGKWRQPMFWFTLSVGVCAFVICGTVYNMIRGPPLFWHDGNSGRIVLLYPSLMNQFVLEGFIATGILALGCSGFYLAATFEPQSRSYPWPPKSMAYVYLGMIFGSYLLLMALFRMKLNS